MDASWLSTSGSLTSRVYDLDLSIACRHHTSEGLWDDYVFCQAWSLWDLCTTCPLPTQVCHHVAIRSVHSKRPCQSEQLAQISGLLHARVWCQTLNSAKFSGLKCSARENDIKGRRLSAHVTEDPRELADFKCHLYAWENIVDPCSKLKSQLNQGLCLWNQRSKVASGTHHAQCWQLCVAARLHRDGIPFEMDYYSDWQTTLVIAAKTQSPSMLCFSVLEMKPMTWCDGAVYKHTPLHTPLHIPLSFRHNN